MKYGLTVACGGVSAQAIDKVVAPKVAKNCSAANGIDGDRRRLTLFAQETAA
jgi:hypothetical protein